MVTQTDNRVEYRNRYYAYGLPCGVDAKSAFYQMPCLTERVESYRGKPLYIDVGSKRRKVFHEFTRWRHTAGEQSSMFWCPGPALTMYAQDFPYAQAAQMCEPWYQNAYPQYISGDFPMLLEYQLKDYAEELREFVIRDLFAKANSPRFEGAVFLAELGETLVGIHKLLAGCAKSLLKADQAWAYVKHFSLNSEEVWLWWRYMLMPTMMEVESIIAALDVQQVIDRVQDGDRYKEPLTLTGELRSGGGSLWNGYTMEMPWRMKIRFGAGGAIDLHHKNTLMDFGVSPWDAIRGAWEAIPLSFVFDWFVNLGDWLASLREAEVVYAQSYATYAIDVETSLLPGSDMDVETQTARSFLMSRIVNLEPPALPLVDRNWRNTLRTVDAISLTIGMLKSILKKRRK